MGEILVDRQEQKSALHPGLRNVIPWRLLHCPSQRGERSNDFSKPKHFRRITATYIINIRSKVRTKQTQASEAIIPAIPKALHDNTILGLLLLRFLFLVLPSRLTFLKALLATEVRFLFSASKIIFFGLQLSCECLTKRERKMRPMNEGTGVRRGKHSLGRVHTSRRPILLFHHFHSH